MEKKIYITEEEREKCRRVVEAFAELYEQENIFMVDARRYGFVELQYYSPGSGFDGVITYTDSRRLFEGLWREWLDTQLFHIGSGTDAMELGSFKGVFESLPEEKQRELMDKKPVFAEKAGIVL